jgi:hypothetical protein
MLLPALSRAKERGKVARWPGDSNKLRTEEDRVMYLNFQHDDEGDSTVSNKALGLNIERYDPTHLDGQFGNLGWWADGRWAGPKRGMFNPDLGWVKVGDRRGNGDMDYSYLDQRDEITIFVWFRTLEFSRNYQAIFSKGDSAWRFSRNGTNDTMHFACSGLSGTWNLNSTSSVNDDRWHLAVGTYDGETLSLYVDGKLEASGAATGKININKYRVEFGANQQRVGRDFIGWIDEGGVLSRALSATEVKDMYAMGNP